MSHPQRRLSRLLRCTARRARTRSGLTTAGNGLGFFPGVGGLYYGGAPYGEAPVNVGQPIPDKYHYTYSYDVPWDWTHRYPLTLPSDRPYVPSCNTEVVTVPGRGGDRSINITRCY